MLNETELKEMIELEDFAHFRADLVEISPESFTLDELKEILGDMITVERCVPESFTLDELKEILGDMIRSKVAMEDDMRESFAALGEVEQTRLLDMLGESGYKDRDWWCRMLLDGPRHREFPTI